MFIMWAGTIVVISVIIVDETYAFSGNTVYDEHRREFVNFLLTTSWSSMAVCNPFVANAVEDHVKHTTIKSIHDPQLRDYTNPLLPKWQGTSLPTLSLSDAYNQLMMMANSEPKLIMGRWPDPILRQPSSPIPLSTFQKNQQLEQLQLVASALRNTARKEGAVGLAAQQCGIDASLIFIDNVSNNKRKLGRIKDSLLPQSSIGVFGQSKWRRSQREVSGEGTSNDDSFFQQIPMQNSQPSNQDSGVFLANPRIIQRSPESEMLVWTEECLVLPPEFRATLLRDAEVTIEYEVLDLEKSSEASGITKQMTLKGELARCCQHEMQHDRGILIVDHASLDELLSVNGNPFMAEIENADGLHSSRMQYAYSRGVSESSLLPADENMVSLAMEDRLGYHTRVHHLVEHNQPWFAQSANAVELEAITKTESDIQRSSPPKVDNPSEYCDDKCLEERKRIIQERRAMMQQSRSNTRRADVLELSKQRASMYETDYKGLTPSNVRDFVPEFARKMLKTHFC